MYPKDTILYMFIWWKAYNNRSHHHFILTKENDKKFELSLELFYVQIKFLQRFICIYVKVAWNSDSLYLECIQAIKTLVVNCFHYLTLQIIHWEKSCIILDQSVNFLVMLIKSTIQLKVVHSKIKKKVWLWENVS